MYSSLRSRHGNFTFDVAVYRGPYEYSRPDCDKDYYPQWEAPKKSAESPRDNETH